MKVRKTFCKSSEKMRWNGKLLALLLVLLSVFAFPSMAFANSPAPAYEFFINIQNVPRDAVGVDVLLPISSMPKGSYQEEKPEILAEAGLSTDCELAVYNDGFVSCLAHYKDVTYDLTFGDIHGAAFFKLGGYTGRERNLFEIISKMKQLKLAVYNKRGDILAVSEPFTTASSLRYTFFGKLTYDVASGHVDVDMKESFGLQLLILLMPLILIISVFVTLLIEMIIGEAFSMEPLKTIAKVTAITNLGMNLVFFLLMVIVPIFSPVVWLLGLEIAVIVIEYQIYKRMYSSHTPAHILRYTIIANAASAAVGMALWASL